MFSLFLVLFYIDIFGKVQLYSFREPLVMSNDDDFQKQWIPFQLGISVSSEGHDSDPKFVKLPLSKRYFERLIDFDCFQWTQSDDTLENKWNIAFDAFNHHFFILGHPRLWKGNFCRCGLHHSNSLLATCNTQIVIEYGKNFSAALNDLNVFRHSRYLFKFPNI